MGNPSAPIFEIISTGTIFIEPKMFHGGKSTPHIEDIILDINKGIDVAEHPRSYTPFDFSTFLI